MRQQVRVVRDVVSRFFDPVALYQNGRFVRLHEVQPTPAPAQRGRSYLCTVQGQRMELWQERERDVWYLEQSLPKAAFG